MSDFNVEFEKIFKIATLSLRLNRSHPGIIRSKVWMFQYILISLVTLISFVFLSNSLLFHDIQAGKYTEASKNGAMTIVSITITFKYFILLYHQDSINVLIRTVDTDYDLAKVFSEEDKDIVRKYSRKGVTVCKYWFVSAFVTSAIFPIKAFALTFYFYCKGENKLVPMFDMTFPYPIEQYKNTVPIYCMLFCLCLLFGCYAASMYIGFDPLVPIFMLHTCGQLELLSKRITKLFSECHNGKEIEEQLKTINLKMQDIYRFVQCVQNNFTFLYEYNMKTTTFLLPLTAFQIVEDLRDKKINLEFISFFTGVILHFFMPCYFSDLLMEKVRNLLYILGERFRQSIYSCGWEKCADKRVRQTVLFMMTRATLPIGISTVFYTICLDTFAEMCRQSYAILNLMNAAWV